MNNVVLNSIDSDYELSTILGNFSDDYIFMSVKNALEYKYRPFNSNRMPNFPTQLYNQFQGIMDHAGTYTKDVQDRLDEIFGQIINIICESYNLSVDVSNILEDQLYSMASTLYQLFISEFSENMFNLFIDYIMNNIDSLVNAIPENERVIKSLYSKKIYSNPNYGIGYDNIEKIINIISELDIDFYTLIKAISNPSIADFISVYVKDCGDIYKNFYACYLLNPNTKTDMFAEIKLRYVSNTTQTANMIDYIPISKDTSSITNKGETSNE